jgi:hypothetical protein
MPGSHRQRVSATVDAKVADALDFEHVKRKRVALDAHQKEPDFSHTVEDVIRKGLQALRNGQ